MSRLLNKCVCNSSHPHTSITLPLGVIDITFHRDDFSDKLIMPKLGPSNIPFDLNNKDVIRFDGTGAFTRMNDESIKFSQERGIGTEDNPYARIEFELLKTKNPLTDNIPYNIRQKELAFAKTLPVRMDRSRTIDWVRRGPYNVGGRTRALAIDKSDEKISMIASYVKINEYIRKNIANIDLILIMSNVNTKNIVEHIRNEKD